MRFAIMGTGGVGGYFGGLLARSGEDVTFIARGAHLAALRRQGLRVDSVLGGFALDNVQVTDDPHTVGPVDVVLFATKTDQLDAAAQAMRPMIGAETTVVPLHNGVDAAERTVAVVGHEHVVGGVCYVASMISAPGVIRHESQFRRVIVGELLGAVTPRVAAIVDALSRSGATAEASPDIQAARWTKFAFIAPLSGLGAVTRVPAGEINAVPEARRMLHEAIGEVEAVARAEGVAVPLDLSEKTGTFCDSLPPGLTSSMQRDVLAGKPSELESIIGVMVRKGEARRVPVPVFQFLYAALLPQERQARAALQ